MDHTERAIGSSPPTTERWGYARHCDIVLVPTPPQVVVGSGGGEEGIVVGVVVAYRVEEELERLWKGR
jgi:hypothetical protein